MIESTGISFRSRHWRSIMETKPNIPWMEVLADNFIGAGGMPAYQLATIAEHYPLTLHSVGLSIGSYEPLNFDYLAQLKALKKSTGAIWLSDHLCFTHAQGAYSHDLLPLPYTEESLNHVLERLAIVQDYLGEAILIENPSSYIDSNTNEFSEAEFLKLLVQEADCKLLLDVNNIHVSQYNRHQNSEDYLRHIPWDSVAEIHLAGFDQQDGILIDAHNNPVSEPVWQLFKQVLQVLPNIPALIEWDNNLPPLEDLIAEQQKAEFIRQQILAREEKPTFQTRTGKAQDIKWKASNKISADLVHWQQQFVAAIYNDPVASKEITAQFSELPNITHDRALCIYQNNCHGARINALEQCYKVCRQLIGDDAFRQQAAQFVDCTPSKAQDLNQYGNHFSTHLSALIKKEPKYSTLTYLPDMAKYEYLYQSIYYAPNAFANELPSSMAINADLLFVTLSEHCRLFTSPYPVSEIWRLHDDDNLEQLPSIRNGEVRSGELYSEVIEYCLIYRNHDLQIVSVILDQPHFKLFEQLADTAVPLAHVVALAETMGLQLNTLLPHWISAGWLSLNEKQPFEIVTHAMHEQAGT